VSLRAVRQASSRVAQDQSQDDDEGQEVRRHPPPPSRALPPRRCWSVLRRCDRACKEVLCVCLREGRVFITAGPITKLFAGLVDTKTHILPVFIL
jgi:hypothetical protein